MMDRAKYKNIQNAMLFFTILVLLAAFYIESANNLEPCPLCLMQRACTFVIGFLCFVGFGLAALHRARSIAVMQLVFALLGIYFAARQIWLQSLPITEGQVCMPGLNALVHYFSYDTVIKAFLWGSSSCGEVTWRGLGLSMPVWALVYFVFISIVNIALLFFLQKKIHDIDSIN